MMSNMRHQELGLSDEQAIDIYRTMLLARKIDERMWLLNRSGKIPFVISCQDRKRSKSVPLLPSIGKRITFYLITVIWGCPCIRDDGERFNDVWFCEKDDPNSGGRQMPGHFGQRSNRIVTGSSPVTTQVPHAVGIALAGRLEQKNFVSFVTFGEGSSNQGDFHEGANFAAVHKLPVIFM